MGWYSTYKIYLSNVIDNFDYEKMDEWIENQDKFFDINYQRYQYHDDLIVYVTIKYGRTEIDEVVYFLEHEYDVKCHITVVSTDDLEWKDWRECYEDDIV